MGGAHGRHGRAAWAALGGAALALAGGSASAALTEQDEAARAGGAGAALGKAASKGHATQKTPTTTSKFKYYSGRPLSDPDNVRVFSGSGNRPLAESMAAYLGISLGDVSCDRYADGEISIKVNENVRGKNVVLVQSCNGTALSDSFVELLLMVSTMRRSSAKSITVVMPYCPYARSDQRGDSRGPIAAKDVMEMLATMGMDRLVVVDMHSGQMQGFLPPAIPSDNVTAITIGANYFAELVPKLGYEGNLVVVAPSADGVARAKQFWNAVNKAGVLARFAMVLRKPALEELARKDRKDNGKTLADWKSAAHHEYEVVGDDLIEGCTAIIVDDILDSCESLCKQAETLKRRGAKHVFAFATHGIFSAGALEKIQQSAVDKVVVSNTALCPEDAADAATKVDWISVAPLLAETVRRVCEKESLSPLFN
jgi:ribose-phosphate pyrophosphokinase